MSLFECLFIFRKLSGGPTVPVTSPKLDNLFVSIWAVDLTFAFSYHKGRPKGSANKSSEVVKKTVAVLLENNIQLVQDDLDQMQPRDRVAAILQFMKFFIPTKKAVEIEDNSQDTRSDYIERLMEIPEENFNDLYERETLED